jgi:two-component system chemotaxis sensor kinase CheA
VVESLRPAVEDVKGLGANRAMMNARSLHPGRSAAFGGANGAVEVPQDGVLIVVEPKARAARPCWSTRSSISARSIKSLDTHYRRWKACRGDDPGDGCVALIVDVDGLVARSLAEHGQLDLSHPHGLAEAA